MGLRYHNPNHTQEAEFFDADGKSVIRFSARINGIEPPTYSSWLTGTKEQYQDNHVEIRQARIQFIQEQGRTERRLVQEIINKREENPEKSDEVTE